MKKHALISFIAVLCAVNQSAALAGSTAPKIWVTAGPYVRWINPPANPPAWYAKRSDEWKMFTPQGEKDWSTVASHVAVLVTAIHSIEASCLENRTTYAKSCTDLGLSNEQSLDQYFRYIKAHHLAFAFEIGLLTDTQMTGSAINAACGQEAGPIREASLRFVFQKIKDAGGEIDYIRMDEPFYYGTRSCHDSVANVAADLSRTIKNIVLSYFPNVQIGDAEPVTGNPGDAETIGQWAEAYRAAVGRPLAFFHADAAWNAGPVISNFAAIAQVMHKKSIPFGIFYNGEDDTSDRGWTQSAIDHFVEAEEVLRLRIDQPLFQAWTAHPTNMLPEKALGTLLNVAFQYVLPPTALTLSRSSGGVQIRLTAENKSPAPGAAVSADAVDVANAWGVLTQRVITGKTPAGAAYGIMAIRANTEGALAVAKGEADLGAIIFHYQDPSAKARIWKAAYPVPHKVVLSPGSKVIDNLPGLTAACGNSAIPLAPDTPFTLEVPMSATASADHAGYVSVVFFDNQCRGISRAYLYFSPSSQSLKLPVTDSAGQIRLNLPKDLLETKSRLRVYYHGDNATRRPSMSILDLK